MANKKILVVDDEEDLIQFVTLRLKANNYDVLTAPDGEQALAAVAKDTPDLIVLDIVLPKIDGHKVCEQLKKNPRFSRIPIIMLTAREKTEDIELAKRMGADAYIAKPFDAQILLYDIDKLLSGKTTIE